MCKKHIEQYFSPYRKMVKNWFIGLMVQTSTQFQMVYEAHFTPLYFLALFQSICDIGASKLMVVSFFVISCSIYLNKFELSKYLLDTLNGKTFNKLLLIIKMCCPLIKIWPSINTHQNPKILIHETVCAVSA